MKIGMQLGYWGLAFAIVAALAACGGGDDGARPTPPAVDHEVTPLAITIDQPERGVLTFDALHAGDPDAATEGRLVLLLHGFPETAESYRDFLAPLAEAGYYAVAVTQRGYSPGARPGDVDAYGIVELVGDVTGIASELGAQEYHLVGHDWGGAVAWLAAAFDPDAVQSLTALSTPHPDAINDAVSEPGPQLEAFDYMEFFRAEGTEQQLLAGGTDAADSFTTVFGTAGGLPADEVERYADVLATPEALGAALNWYRANPLPMPARIGDVRVPTLYVYGVDDMAFLPATARATGDLVDAPYTYRELEGYGHWLPETAAAEVVPDLIEHLDNVEP